MTTYPYEGREVSAPQLQRELPGYGVNFLRRALREGCTCRADITAMEVRIIRDKPVQDRRGAQGFQKQDPMRGRYGASAK